jgi:4-carboxymuconolactone decarboxylase
MYDRGTGKIQREITPNWLNEETKMQVLKIVGITILAGAAGLLLGERIQAERAVSTADTPEYPKDVYADSRNRLPFPKREELDDEGKKVYDYIIGPKRLAGATPTVRVYSPKLAAPLEEMAKYLKYETGLPDRLLEIAVLTTARENECQFEWTQWETHGRDPKDSRHIEPEIIDIIKFQKPVTGLGEKETTIINFGREMITKRKVSSATFADTLRLFGQRGTLDLVWLMGDYTAASLELTAFDQQLLPGQKPLLPSR